MNQETTTWQLNTDVRKRAQCPHVTMRVSLTANGTKWQCEACGLIIGDFCSDPADPTQTPNSIPNAGTASPDAWRPKAARGALAILAGLIALILTMGFGLALLL